MLANPLQLAIHLHDKVGQNNHILDLDSRDVLVSLLLPLNVTTMIYQEAKEDI